MAKMHADLVAALEAKNSIAQRALDTKLFTVVVPDDPEAQLFFAMKRKEAVLRARADLLLAETKGLATPSKRQKRDSLGASDIIEASMTADQTELSYCSFGACPGLDTSKQYTRVPSGRLWWFGSPPLLR
ncbi:hypothetical protein AaE_012067 [Aphanomyces astaci]|uniref:Uncharacterized protein n=1 Tax=Aphanomyces astaci TaxID=112090 RepID=A0A6A4ZL08_APHAT|nr:hypothetical protein AaE_012067 [Aphanomyces astaci]